MQRVQIPSVQIKRTIKTKGYERNAKTSQKDERVFKKTIQTEGISFYFDGAGYQHKYNPFDEARSVKSMTMHQRSDV